MRLKLTLYHGSIATMTTSNVGTHVYLNTDFDTALSRVTEALKSEGFGVLTEIDVRATLKNKLNVDFRPYKILGACNPPLAYRALSSDPEVGMLLPCNVTVALEDDGRVLVSLVNPLSMMGVLGGSELEAVADEASERLGRVAEALAG
jgi:uncharacterized protein (DUF302 family)